MHWKYQVLRRDPYECSVNMLAWQANVDIQFVLNAYACVMYVASYIMKTERSMGELLKLKPELMKPELMS